ncbi:hypothetical protein ACJRO7_003442 [Eucalyptus globulus]|uniref:Uncharacterized protein n=1 Tax=Eucalyptus globulus TaxID=34317 RepID=A0ABD3IVU5_EUCGL
MNEVHTTHSWDFLGVNLLHQYNQLGTDTISNVVGGVIDSESLSDKDLGPVPQKFKAHCIPGDNFTLSNYDRSHTASTIAGSVVSNTGLLGMAQGAAWGGAPSARLAIYKACWFNMCTEANVLAAMDDGIVDSVDVLSLQWVHSLPNQSIS